MVLPFTLCRGVGRCMIARNAASGGSGAGWALSQQALGWCWGLASAIVFCTQLYICMFPSCVCNTHAHNLHSLSSQLSLLSSPSALDCLWSYGCFHTLCIHLDLFPSPYNVFHSHSSGPFALLFCLLFLLLLSRLLQAPPNRLSIGIQRLTLTVQVLYFVL